MKYKNLFQAYVFVVIICLLPAKGNAIAFTATLPLGSPEATDFHVSMPGEDLGDVSGMFSVTDLLNTIRNNLAIATTSDGSTRQLNLTGGFIGNNTGFFGSDGGDDGLLNSIGVDFPRTPLLPGETITVDFPTIPVEFEDELAQFFSFTFSDVEALIFTSFKRLTIKKGRAPLIEARKDDDLIVIKFKNDSVVIFGISEPSSMALFVMGLAGYGFVRKIKLTYKTLKL